MFITVYSFILCSSFKLYKSLFCLIFNTFCIWPIFLRCIFPWSQWKFDLMKVIRVQFESHSRSEKTVVSVLLTGECWNNMISSFTPSAVATCLNEVTFFLRLNQLTSFLFFLLFGACVSSTLRLLSNWLSHILELGLSLRGPVYSPRPPKA